MQNIKPTSHDLLNAFNVVISILEDWQNEEEDDASTSVDPVEYAEHRARWYAYRSARFAIAQTLGQVARDTLLAPDLEITLLDLIEYADRSEYDEVIQSLRP